MADGAVTGYAAGSTPVSKGVIAVQWTSWAGTTTGIPLTLAAYPDKTVAAHGTWGGATLVVEGSMDGTNYFTLNDSRGEGNAISLTADNIVTILENPYYVRCKPTGGTGTALTVTIVAQSGRR